MIGDKNEQDFICICIESVLASISLEILDNYLNICNKNSKLSTNNWMVIIGTLRETPFFI